MVDNLCYIKPKNSLKKKDKKQKIINAIKDKITSLHNFQLSKNGNTIDPELILMVCNCVENTVKKHAGIDKKEFVKEILNNIFGPLNQLNQQEIMYVDAQCQYNFDNKLIEKIPVTYKVGSILYHYIKSKL